MIPKARATYTDAVVLRCDVCKDEIYVGGAGLHEEVRVIAARSGWTYDGKQDICPKHPKEDAVDRRPHSRACGIKKHEHGPDCHSNCPTCGGRA